MRYRNDPRFLRLWLLVAHQAREPIDVFKYLSVNKIGSELALYYEEYANYLEKSSRYDCVRICLLRSFTPGRNKEAMEVYTLGIGRKAAPLERLSRHFAEFQRRMVCVSSTGVSEEEPRAPVVKPSASSSSSSSVGTKKSLISSSRDSKSVAASKGKGNGQRFQVFCDDEQEDDSAANQEVLLPSASSANAWKEYGNEKSRTKENYVEPTPWAGQTLKQTKGAPRMEKIHVFQDEEGPEVIGVSDF